VDACDGNNEGQNEMLQLITGYKALPANAFSVAKYKSGLVNWGSSSNPFRGFAAKSNTLNQKINSINQQIKQSQNCGHFILLSHQDFIPPHSKVLIITSTDFNPSAHDFSPLQDTMYVLVQKSGNTAGHFVNYGNSDTRTLILQNGNQADTVTYNRSKLLKQNGNKGGEDGAFVLFEVEHLANASPATVSRAGIIYLSGSELGWRPLVTSRSTPRMTPSTPR